MMSSMSTRSMGATRFVAAPKRAIAAKAAAGDAKTLNGISGPLGYFDPLSLAATAKPADVKRWREAELTHGRVAMLAALGFIVGEAVEGTSLFYNFDGGISGPAIVHFQQTKQGFWEPLVLTIGIAEAFRVAKGWSTPVGNDFNTLEEDYQPGDLGFDPLGLCPTDKEEFDTLQTKELNNGRLAMISVAGFVAQELVDKKPILAEFQ